MAQPFFKFKQFTVFHDKCAMKVGTDGVLLGAWTEINQAKRILDVGTGTGLIALMLAQRSDNCEIVGIDIDENAAQQATDNFIASPFSDRLTALCHKLQDFETDKKFDLIVSNPPYFVNSLKCPDDKRSNARHTDSLPLDTLLTESKRLLSDSGRLALILPYEQDKTLRSIAETVGLFLKRFATVLPTPSSSPKRLLAEFSASPIESENDIEEERIVIELSRHVYSQGYIDLTKDFYLNM
jgi:tRNA1Val (adenine37-N6)-methyltransferase